MADLQAIMAETSKSYDQSRNALNNQINAIATDLAAQKDRINAQYAQQSKDLQRQKNNAASTASMNAARTGGSFGGASAIANEKYYQQAYVPAVTQMQTNQANDISSAETQANQNKLSLEQTLASLNDEATRYALQRYDAAVQAEREEAYRQEQLKLQRQQIAAQNAYNSYLSGGSGSKYSASWNNGDGRMWYYNNNTGASVRFGTFAKNSGGNYKGLLASAAGAGDPDAKAVMQYLNSHPNATVSYMGGSGTQYYKNSGLGTALNRLGIKVSGINQNGTWSGGAAQAVNAVINQAKIFRR